MKKTSLSLCFLAVISSVVSAQENPLSYEIGVNSFNFRGKGTKTDSHPSGGLSPYVGITYHLPESKVPLSIGLRANMFRMDINYANSDPKLIYDQYSFAHDFVYLQFQMPISYHWHFRNSNLSAALSPTLYYNTYSKFDAGNQHTRQDPNEIAFSNGTSYIHPQKLTANFDLSIAYEYYFKQIGKHQLGLKAYASYPLLNSLPVNTTYEYNLEHSTLGNLSKSSLITHNYTPVTLGIGVIFR